MLLELYQAESNRRFGCSEVEYRNYYRNAASYVVSEIERILSLPNSNIIPDDCVAELEELKNALPTSRSYTERSWIEEGHEDLIDANGTYEENVKKCNKKSLNGGYDTFTDFEYGICNECTEDQLFSKRREGGTTPNCHIFSDSGYSPPTCENAVERHNAILNYAQYCDAEQQSREQSDIRGIMILEILGRGYGGGRPEESSIETYLNESSGDAWNLPMCHGIAEIIHSDAQREGWTLDDERSRLKDLLESSSSDWPIWRHHVDNCRYFKPTPGEIVATKKRACRCAPTSSFFQ